MGEAKTRITTVKGIIDAAPGGNECFVVIYGGTLGRKYELSEDVVSLGRDPENSIVIDVDSVSRKHARVETSNGQKFLVDLNSTNGTYMNDELIVREKLNNGDLIKVGDTIFKFLSGGNIESAYHEEIYTMTVTDGLTQIPNRRLLNEYVEREFSRARRYGRNLSCVLFDIDHFTNINNEYGHLTGDYILKELAAAVVKRIRKEEIFARYGGEEFVIVLPEAEKVDVTDFAESIRQLIEQHKFEFEGNTIAVTVSMGVGHISESMTTHLSLIKAADDNMYKAKRGGRNRVCG